MVETRRIELLSENAADLSSPSAAYDLDSPFVRLTSNPDASVASLCMADAKLSRLTFTAHDARFPVAVPRGGQLP